MAVAVSVVMPDGGSAGNWKLIIKNDRYANISHKAVRIFRGSRVQQHKREGLIAFSHHSSLPSFDL